MENTEKISKYDIVIEGEPKEVTEARHKILDTFKDLIFVEEGHHYYIDGEEIQSVSKVIHQFEQEFDSDAQAEKTAEKTGRTKQEVLDEWYFKNRKSTVTGTLVHEFGESYGWFKANHLELITESCKSKYLPEKNWLIPTRKKEEAIIKFMNDLPKSYHLVLNEAKVYSGLNPIKELNPKTRYSGTFDMLYYYDGEGNPDKAGFIIFDYKTNGSLEKEYSIANGIYMKEPFINLYNQPKSVYTLQLSAYQLALEDIGFKVIDRKLIWLKDDGEYEKITLPDLTSTLRSVL